jgi:uncharacterized iron-regulated membrane protein
LRKALLTFHRWAGLVAGVAIFVIAVTGCALVFEDDIDRLLNRELTVVEPGPRTLTHQTALDAVRSAYPAETPNGIVLPGEPLHALVINLTDGRSVAVDQYRGQVLGARGKLGGFARFLRRLHKTLLAGAMGQKIVGSLTLLTLLLAVSGVILWWPRWILVLKSSRSWRRANFDLHNLIGFYSAVFLVVMCVSGVMITFADVIDPLILELDSAAPPEPLRRAPQVSAGATEIGPDEAVRLAGAVLPGAFVRRVSLPRPGSDVYQLGMNFPEDRTPGGRSRVILDRYGGRVLEVENARTARLGRKLLNLKRPIHTGEVLGAPTQVLAFLVSLSLTAQVITGFLIWWRPGRLPSPARLRRAARP